MILNEKLFLQQKSRFKFCKSNVIAGGGECIVKELDATFQLRRWAHFCVVSAVEDLDEADEVVVRVVVKLLVNAITEKEGSSFYFQKEAI